MSHPIYRLVETTPPAVEPLDLSEVKTFLRLDHDSDDALISTLIAAARQACETATGRSLITRGYSLYLDGWATDALSLPKPPLLTVAQVKVYEADGTSTVFSSDNYYVDTKGVPGRIILTEGAVKPAPGRVANGIEIQYTAGYGAAASNVPALLRQGIKQLVAHLYEHRGDSHDQALLSSGAAAIFTPYRAMSLS